MRRTQMGGCQRRSEDRFSLPNGPYISGVQRLSGSAARVWLSAPVVSFIGDEGNLRLNGDSPDPFGVTPGQSYFDVTPSGLISVGQTWTWEDLTGPLVLTNGVVPDSSGVIF